MSCECIELLLKKAYERAIISSPASDTAPFDLSTMIFLIRRLSKESDSVYLLYFDLLCSEYYSEPNKLIKRLDIINKVFYNIKDELKNILGDQVRRDTHQRAFGSKNNRDNNRLNFKPFEPKMLIRLLGLIKHKCKVILRLVRIHDEWMGEENNNSNENAQREDCVEIGSQTSRLNIESENNNDEIGRTNRLDGEIQPQCDPPNTCEPTFGKQSCKSWSSTSDTSSISSDSGSQATNGTEVDTDENSKDANYLDDFKVPASSPDESDNDSGPLTIDAQGDHNQQAAGGDSLRVAAYGSKRSVESEPAGPSVSIGQDYANNTSVDLTDIGRHVGRAKRLRMASDSACESESSATDYDTDSIVNNNSSKSDNQDVRASGSLGNPERSTIKDWRREKFSPSLDLFLEGMNPEAVNKSASPTLLPPTGLQSRLNNSNDSEHNNREDVVVDESDDESSLGESSPDTQLQRCRDNHQNGTTSGNTKGSTFRQYIVKIEKWRHRRGTTKLLTRWGPYNVTLWDTLALVRAHDEKGTKKFFEDLKRNKPRSYKVMVQRNPNLLKEILFS